MILDSLCSVTGQSYVSISHWIVGLSLVGFIGSIGAMIYYSKRL